MCVQMLNKVCSIDATVSEGGGNVGIIKPICGYITLNANRKIEIQHEWVITKQQYMGSITNCSKTNLSWENKNNTCALT